MSAAISRTTYENKTIHNVEAWISANGYFVKRRKEYKSISFANSEAVVRFTYVEEDNDWMMHVVGSVSLMDLSYLVMYVNYYRNSII